MILIKAVSYSNQFLKLMVNFHRFQNYIEDQEYLLKMLKIEKVLTRFVGIYSIIKISTFIYIEATQNNYLSHAILPVIMYRYFLNLYDYRLILEYFTQFGILYVISEQINAVTRLVNREMVIKNREFENNIENGTNIAVTKNTYLWIIAYENISNSSKLFKEMFSVQVILKLIDKV